MYAIRSYYAGLAHGAGDGVGVQRAQAAQVDDLDAVTGALEAARATTDRPTLIVVESHIGYGAPEKQDTAAAHGAPLGPEQVRAAKRAYRNNFV